LINALHSRPDFSLAPALKLSSTTWRSFWWGVWYDGHA
jgi:hypothetical protein